MLNRESAIVPGIGDRIRKFRKSKGLSQKDLGGFIRKSTAQVSEIERENGGLTIYTLSFLMRELNLNPFWLFFEEGEPTLESPPQGAQDRNNEKQIGELLRRIERLEDNMKL